MIRSDKYKYVYHSSGASKFYDLELNPGETVNPVDKSEYQTVTGQVTASLLSWYRDTCDIVSRTTDERFSRQVVWEKVKRLCPAGHEGKTCPRIEHGMGLFPIWEYCRQLRKRQETNSAENKQGEKGESP